MTHYRQAETLVPRDPAPRAPPRRPSEGRDSVFGSGQVLKISQLPRLPYGFGQTVVYRVKRVSSTPHRRWVFQCPVPEHASGRRGAVSVANAITLATLVYQGSDPKLPDPALVIRQSATLGDGFAPQSETALSGPPTTGSGMLEIISPDVGDCTSFTPSLAKTAGRISPTRCAPAPRFAGCAAHSCFSGSASLAYSEQGSCATAASRSLLVSLISIECAS